MPQWGSLLLKYTVFLKLEFSTIADESILAKGLRMFSIFLFSVFLSILSNVWVEKREMNALIPFAP